MSGDRRLVLRSRRVVTPDGTQPADVVVERGRIVEIAGYSALGDSGALGESDALGDSGSVTAIEDLGSLALIPGAVDLHVHVNEPGRTEWEGFASATAAAAAGGVTTLVDMPLNSSPVTTTVAALEEKRTAARGRCLVDVAFHGGLVPENARDADGLGALLGSGIVGIKAFLCDSGLPEFGAVSSEDLAAAMPAIAASGLPLLVHAERVADGTPVGSLPSPRYADYLSSRPSSMELAAIDEMIGHCRSSGCRVHVVHLASAEAAPRLRAAKAEGLPITVETCPHYLTFCAEEIGDGEVRFQCAPPIRDAEHREALWRALLDGTIDLVASDHSPCPPALKARSGKLGDFGAAWGGISSLEVSVAATWTGLRARGGDLARLVEWTAARPAALLGLERKGRIERGADADLVAFDDEACFLVDGARLHHRHPLTAYQGRELVGVARRTWSSGVLVQEEGRIAATPNGRLLSREATA